MVNNPHQLLGVSENATQDEIKRAYRRKAKECHPDLHPGDPDAARKAMYEHIMESMPSWEGEDNGAERAENKERNERAGKHGGRPEHAQAEKQPRQPAEVKEDILLQPESGEAPSVREDDALQIVADTGAQDLL